MPKKIAVNLLGWKHPAGQIFPVIEAVLAQDYENFELQYMDNNPGSAVSGAVREKFGDRVKVVQNDTNLGYAGGHNKFFAETDAELLMVLNPDAVLAPGFLSAIAKIFDDEKVGAATGKMVRPEKVNDEWILDGTGIVMNIARRGRERGQTEVDRGQFDSQPNVFGVSGTAAVYRKSALQAVELPGHEFFDTDFFAYWEDFDLSWRLHLAGYECRYAPGAVVYHGRVASASKGGYKNPVAYYKHHSALSVNIRRWNWRNHLFAIIKNDFGWPLVVGFPFIAAREAAMFCWILVFEPSTLPAVPEFFRLLPKMLAKRKIIQGRRVVTVSQMGKWF
jgi:GT2 family glycosyltransferase